MRLTWHNNNIKGRRHRSNKEFHKFHCNFKYLWMQYFFKWEGMSQCFWCTSFGKYECTTFIHFSCVQLKFYFKMYKYNISNIFVLFQFKNKNIFQKTRRIYFYNNRRLSTVVKKTSFNAIKKFFFNKIKNKEKIFALEFFSFLSEWNLGKNK